MKQKQFFLLICKISMLVLFCSISLSACLDFTFNNACNGNSSSCSNSGNNGANSLGSVNTTQNTALPAATIISNPHMTSSIDSNYAPTHITSTFTTGQTIYVTFHIDSKGQTGCIEAKWYSNQQLLDSGNFAHDPKNNVGYFSQNSYDTPTSGTVKLYWSSYADCSNLQSAQVVTFTVTS